MLEHLDDPTRADRLTAHMTFQLMHQDGDLPGPPVPVTLSWTRAAAAEIGMAFRTQAGITDWIVARDVLLDGLRRPSGDGDVHVEPNPLDRQYVLVRLANATERAIFQVEAHDLEQFLGRTLRACQLGQEYPADAVDAALAQLLDAA